MTLDEYLSLPGAPTAVEFATRCDPPISAMSISRIRKGQQNITRDTMRSIIAASNGVVTAEGLVLVDEAAPEGSSLDCARDERIGAAA